MEMGLFKQDFYILPNLQQDREESNKIYEYLETSADTAIPPQYPKLCSCGLAFALNGVI